jgi:hypothetical protein
MKTAIIALSAVALMTAAPVVAAQSGSGKTSDLPHHVAKTPHVSASARSHEVHATASHRHSSKRYPNAFGYAPTAPSVADPDFVRSRQFGGGGAM